MATPETTPQLCRKFHRASELVGRRWTGAIIYVLLKARCRFATLREAIPDITDRMLSERLQELEQEGIVERTVVAWSIPGKTKSSMYFAAPVTLAAPSFRGTRFPTDAIVKMACYLKAAGDARGGEPVPVLFVLQHETRS